MKNYLYKCTSCNQHFSFSEIEDNAFYICPTCGIIEKNQPLKGVLEILYDYDEIKNNTSKESFLKNEIGKFWQYSYLFPLEYNSKNLIGVSESELNKLTLPNNPISEIIFGDKILQVFDDSRNPTLSYKDRASILIVLKAKQLGIKEISAASTGNAGSSLAGICARMGLKSHIFVPKNIPESKRIQIQSYGANIYVVDGDYDQAFDLCLEISKNKNWYNRNTGYNPLTIEGKKSAVYDMFISLSGELPENIFVSVGDGVIISGIYKGLSELLTLGWIDKLPKLFAVQATGSSALIKYLNTDIFEYNSAFSIADSICAGSPRNLYMAAESVKNTNGKGIEVSDEEIISAQKILAQEYGILSEPAASASFAGYLKLNSEENIIGSSILMITGNGLKDVSSLKSWNSDYLIKSYKEWKIELT